MADDPEDDDSSDLKLVLNPAAQIEHLLAVGQVKRAKDLVAELIAADPEDPSTFLSLSRILLRERDTKAAVAAAEEAIKYAPEWAAAWSARAIALFRDGQFAAAEESIIHAIELEPDDAGLFENYGRILEHCGKSAKALDLAQRALELDPDDEYAHRMFAELLHEVHPSKWRVSEEAAQRALQLNPDDADSFAILGTIKLSRRRLGEAEELFRSALEIEPHNALAIRGLAEVVMSKNILYRPFLSYALMMQRLGVGVQLMVVGSIWAFASALVASTTPPASDYITYGYLALCAYTWFAEPITRALLRRRYPWL